MKTENILQAFGEAEKLLGEAEQKIREIETADVEKDLADAIESFKKKVEQAKESSRAKKVAFLKAILPVATLMPKICIGLYKRKKRNTNYFFDDEGKQIGVQVHGKRHYLDTPEGFIQSDGENFFNVCDDIFMCLRGCLAKAAKDQEDEVQKFERIKASFLEFLKAQS